ncbi:MAG: phosphate signaling complex protein PhoU [Oscillospiraceae bacterium]|jgi:phosphate transport system protein|nr:phosphate signaling complex protein PhoU [Oscillospiraceae bacterium]
MRNRFDQQLEKLNNMLIEMGGLIEAAIEKSIQALTKLDVELAHEVIVGDADIDEMEKEIERLSLKLIVRQQPVAGDLRLISAALKMITDMERIGDQAADIAEITTMLAGLPTIKFDHVTQMAEATSRMVTRSIEAFVKKDLALVQKVKDMDDQVDELFRLVKNDVIHLLHDHQTESEQAIDLLMIAKYFERIGDHAENIAEWAEYSITGVHEAHRQKDA